MISVCGARTVPPSRRKATLAVASGQSIQYYIEVKDAQGKVETWAIECGAPNSLMRRGLNKNSIPIGSELVIRGYGTRDGSNKAVGRDIQFADGRALFFEGSRPDGGAPAQ